MTVATKYWNFQTQGAPEAVDRYAAEGKTCPNLLSIYAYLKDRYGGMLLGIAPYRRTVIGGTSKSTHWWGALDWRYQDPGPGRPILLREILPFLISWSGELGVQSIHDYAFTPGGRIWRPPGTSGRPAGSDGWKQQSGSGQFGKPGNLWIHVEVHPDNWFDGRSVVDRVATGGNSVVVHPPTIQNGSSGGWVRKLQAILAANFGQPVTVDGGFGPQTQKAVTDVQRFFGLTADGIVGEKTWGLVLGLAP